MENLDIIISSKLMSLAFEFIIILIAFGLFYYALPVSIAYFLFFSWDGNPLRANRIQDRTTSARDIRREITSSCKAIVIFSILITILVQSIKAGKSAIYTDIDKYGIIYFVCSPLLAMIIHDSYYYWLHRAMHNPLLFRWFHALHHKSGTPTPWAIYAFQPLEVIFTFLSFALIVILLPLHPMMLGVYLFVSLFNNIAGHLGFEIVPPLRSTPWLTRYCLTVSFHDLHHSSIRTNYGVYFLFWDSLMNTVHPKYKEIYSKAVSKGKHDRA